MSSDKKINANRENGRKGKGPTSAEGKAWSRRNALKSGLFSGLLVVAAAGEKQEDFDAVLSQVREQFPPQDFLIGFLGGDLAKTIWEFQRLSQYQTAEIRKQCNTARCRRSMEKMAEVDSLKARFLQDFSGPCMNAPLSADRVAFSASLEDTRRHLEQTSTGIEFLIEQIEFTQRELERDGYLSPTTQGLLINSCGMGDEPVKYVVSLNRIAKTEMEKLHDDEEADKNTFEQNKRFLLDLLKSKIQTMRAMKGTVEELESAEEKDYLASLVMPPAEVLEKISGVDARLRRNFYKTLDVLIAVVYGNDR